MPKMHDHMMLNVRRSNDIPDDCTAGKLPQMSLVGQTPEVSLTAALAAVKFNIAQSELEAQLREEQLQKKLDNNQSKFQKKLQEIFTGYKSVSYVKKMKGSELVCCPQAC